MEEEKILEMDNLENVSGGKEPYIKENPVEDPPIKDYPYHKKRHPN